MCQFFLFLSKDIIKILSATFAIVIKNLELCLNNSNLLIKKKAIPFKFLAQKEEIDKQS